jgi:hypothetical protein
MHATVFEYCINNTKPYSKPSITQVDTNRKTIIPTGKLVFSESPLSTYGFDDWHAASVEKNGTIDKISYLSIAAGCSTFVDIKLNGNLRTAYSKIIATLPTAYSDGISFSSTKTIDTLLLTDTINRVPIYAKTNALTDKPISLNVYGVYDPAKPACLAGDCYGSEDNLKIVVYNETVCTTCKLYLVNNTIFNPTNQAWKTGFNNIIKQAVIKMSDPIKIPSTNMVWDKNKNKIIDMFISTYNIPDDSIRDYDEYFELLFQHEE